MYYATITNPKSGRSNNVRVMPITGQSVYDILRSKTEPSARDISWALLDQRECLDDMSEEMGGDSARSNFALSVFENALDFRLGMAVMHYIKAVRESSGGRRPTIIRAAVNRSGDVFILSKTHNVLLSF